MCIYIFFCVCVCVCVICTHALIYEVSLYERFARQSTFVILKCEKSLMLQLYGQIW